MASNTSPAPHANAPPCPFCHGTRTEIMSLFGSHASLTTCWCADCRSPFEFLRWRDPSVEAATGAAEEASRNMDRRSGVE